MNMLVVLLGLCASAGVVTVGMGLRNSRKGSIQKRSRHRAITCALMACLLAPWLVTQAQAQEVVHALTGTLTALNAKESTFSITMNDGSLALFNTAAAKHLPITFSKEVEAQTVAANAFHTIGAQILVLYYGVDTVKTAVAIQNLGPDPLVRVAGTVKSFDKHRHAIAVDGSASAPVDLLVSADTIIDTPNGVVEGLKYHPNKGEHVGAVIKSAAGARSTVLISATGPNAA